MIVYDFDGTIADSLAVTIEAYNRIAAEKGFRPVTESFLQSMRDQAPREVLKELGISLYQAPRLFYRVLREVKQAVIVAKTNPGMKEMLYQAHDLGYRQAILTSNLEDNVRGFLRHNEIDIFDLVYCGSGIFGKDKVLIDLLKDAGLTRQEVVYVGDEVRDIEAARKTGIPIISVSWGFSSREALESHQYATVVDHPEEILPAVNGL